MADERIRNRWWRYLYLTKDFGSDSADLLPYDAAELDALKVPEGWSALEAIQKIPDEIVEQEMSDGSPFDAPEPDIDFRGHAFMFNGKFRFGSRTECQNAVIERGGSAPTRKNVSREIDFLVIGSDGSKAWKRGSYGNKIEGAIIARREQGTPAIVSEDHWALALEKG